MLRSGWWTATTDLRSSAEGGNFCFPPLELHLEPPDLLEELGLAGRGVRRGRLGRSFKDPRRPGDQLLLPGVDQRRRDAVVTGQLVDRAVPLVGGQGDLGLEGPPMDLPLARHWFPSSGPPV